MHTRGCCFRLTGGPERWRVIAITCGGRHSMVLAVPITTDPPRGAVSRRSSTRHARAHAGSDADGEYEEADIETGGDFDHLRPVADALEQLTISRQRSNGTCPAMQGIDAGILALPLLVSGLHPQLCTAPIATPAPKA